MLVARRQRVGDFFQAHRHLPHRPRGGCCCFRKGEEKKRRAWELSNFSQQEGDGGIDKVNCKESCCVDEELQEGDAVEEKEGRKEMAR